MSQKGNGWYGMMELGLLEKIFSFGIGGFRDAACLIIESGMMDEVDLFLCHFSLI
jgi:hypothetical protein